MRFLCTLILAFLCLNHSFAQVCSENGLVFNSQEEIDNFPVNFPNCTEVIGDLMIAWDSIFSPITNLEGLSQLTSIEGVLQIEATDLVDLSDLENIDSLAGLLVMNNPLLLNLDGLGNVNSWLAGVVILSNNSLTNITGLSGTLLGDNLPTITIISGNPNLSYCNSPTLCNFLLNPTGIIVDISGNAEGCNSIDEILFTCDEFSRISHLSFYDINQNKIQDAGEPNHSNISVTLDPQEVLIVGSPSTYYVSPGNYTATYNEAENENWQLTTDSTSYFLSVEAGEEVTFAFGVYPSQLVSQLTSFITSPNARCNEDVVFDISTRNTGTTIASGTMWLQIDDDVTQINFLTPPDETVSGTPTYYGWNFTDLYPGEIFSVEVELGIPGPPDFPVGDFLNFLSYTDYNDTNGAHTSEGFRYDAEVRCSFDPNDKLVSPTRFHYEVLFDEDLIYTVRFQNTGNDVAYDVKILDTLDANLDWSTFRVLGSSHSEVLSTSLNEEGVVTFDFTDIFLPDSTSNLEGSNGHVTYMIRALDGIDENTVIRNSAGIYFDQNPPVITNTTLSVMVSMLTSTTTPDDLFPDLTILPNPNTGTFQVEGIPRGTYNLLNTKGQIIQSGQLESGTLIDISQAAQGVYFIQMMIDEQMVTRRVVKL